MTEDKSLVKSEQRLRLFSSRRQPPLLVPCTLYLCTLCRKPISKLHYHYFLTVRMRSRNRYLRYHQFWNTNQERFSFLDWLIDNRILFKPETLQVKKQKTHQKGNISEGNTISASFCLFVFFSLNKDFFSGLEFLFFFFHIYRLRASGPRIRSPALFSTRAFLILAIKKPWYQYCKGPMVPSTLEAYCF